MLFYISLIKLPFMEIVYDNPLQFPIYILIELTFVIELISKNISPLFPNILIGQQFLLNIAVWNL